MTTRQQTAGGIRFGLVEQKIAAPAPTLFVFALSAQETLANGDYAKVGRLLGQQGWRCVSLDVPCHGEDVRPGEPPALNGWRARLDQNENFIAPFVANCRAVLEHLVTTGLADPHRVAVAGTSRGGFCALHVAAAEPRVHGVVAFAPVTDLPVLAEFKGLENHALTQSLAAANLADRLAGRPIWICIGHNDQRVGTDHCVACARRLGPVVELHVLPSAGHAIPATAHDTAATWLTRQQRSASCSGVVQHGI